MERNKFNVEKEPKIKQIVVRFDKSSYDKISKYAKLEHRGLGEFVRHAALYYIENFQKTENKKEDKQIHEI